MKFIESELAYKLTYKDIVDIIKIIDDASCHELQIELEDLKLKIIKGNMHGSAPIATSAVVPPASAVSEPRNREAAEQPLTKSKHKTGIKPVYSKDASNKKSIIKINFNMISSPILLRYYWIDCPQSLISAPSLLQIPQICYLSEELNHSESLAQYFHDSINVYLYIDMV